MLTKTQLTNLRSQISIGSIYYNDYLNDMGIDKHKVCDFFDGFLSYIEELIEEKYGKYTSSKDQDEKWNSHWEEFDTEDYLWDWYCCFEEEPLPIEEEEK